VPLLAVPSKQRVTVRAGRLRAAFGATAGGE
jgi:hypothetical protein